MNSSNPLAAGGEMGMQIEHFDWSATPIGPIDTWPPSLRITLSTLLRSPLPTSLLWGTELICLYNNKFKEAFDTSWLAPAILGLPARTIWGRRWEDAQGLIHRICSTGEALMTEFSLVPVRYQKDTPSAVYRYSYSPVINELGQIDGILITAIQSVSTAQAGHWPEEKRNHNGAIIEMLDLFDQTPVSIASLSADRTLRFLSANRSYGNLVGRDPADLIGKPLLEALPEIDGQGFDELLHEVVRTGLPHAAYEVPVQLTRRNRMETVYVNFSYVPRFNTDKKVTGILVTVTDVSYHVLARKAVEEKETLFRSLIQAAPFPIGVYIGEQLRIEHANPAIIQIYAKGPDVIGKGYLELLPELMEQAVGQQVMDVYHSGRPFFSETSRVDINVAGKNVPYYFKYSFVPLFDSGGKVYGVLNTGVDVTEVETARQRAQEAEATLRSAIELAELADWQIDLSTRTLFCSERLMAWTGLNGSSIPLADFLQLVPAPYRPLTVQAYEEALEKKDGSAVFDMEHPLTHPTATHPRFVHVRGQLITDSFGKAIRLSGTMQDITQQRAVRWALEHQVAERTAELAKLNTMLSELNAELKHSNEELSQYAYVTSHDLQEPLRKIRMYISWLQEKFPMPAESAALLDKINRSSNRMTELIKDLLGFSRLLGGNMTMQSVNLRTIVTAVLEDFELAIQEKNAVVHVDPLPTVIAVSLQLNQLFHNLIGNALKFADPARPARIAIKVRRVPRTEAVRFIPQTKHAWFHEISVTDNGIGFENQYAEYIFELFRQLHTRNRYPGSGIGLALCRRIAANHGGYIYATSDPGAGSRFILLLPDNAGSNTAV